MKTIFSLQTGIATLLCTAALAGLMACDADTVEQQGGKLPDKEPLENIYGRLRSSSMSDDKVRIRMTEGSGFVTSNFYYQFSKAPASELSLDAWIDGSLLDGWNEAQRTLLPEGNYDFPDGKTLSLSAENQRSALKRIRFMAENLAPGEYYLPLTVAEEAGTEEHQTINYLISIRARQLGEYKLNADQVFAVFYLDTEKYQPLLVDEYLMSKLDANTWENAWSEREDGLRTIGNIVNLNKVVLDYDAETGRALLNLGNDMRYVLDHIDKYIRPLQDKGRKVCICLEGGGTGLGFCNLTDAQIVDFVAQVKTVITEYALDGVNFWDRNAAYGKEGMPAMNTTSYPKLIKAMREALGNKKNVQIVDPWHQGQQYVSTDHPRKPIAGLDPAKYGCINIPWYPQGPNTINDYFTDIFFWRQAGNKQSNILVFESLRTLLQDNFESTWASSIQVGYTYFADDGAWMIEDTPWGPSIMSDNEYSFDTSLLGKLPNGGTGYNKWLKDW